MHASYTILWLLLCVHESQYVEYAEEDYTDFNMKENEELLYFNNIFNFTEKMLLIILRLNLILLRKAVGYIP